MRDDALLAFEAQLVEALGPGEAPSPEVVARTLRRASAELAASARPRELAAELARLLAAAALPVGVAVLWNLAVLRIGSRVLAWLLPTPLALAIPWLYVFGAVGWLALLFAALPSLAHLRLARRYRETLS